MSPSMTSDNTHPSLSLSLSTSPSPSRTSSRLQPTVSPSQPSSKYSASFDGQAESSLRAESRPSPSLSLSLSPSPSPAPSLPASHGSHGSSSSRSSSRHPDNHATRELGERTDKSGYLSVARRRVRRSGGFLLDNTFGLGHRRDGSRRARQESRDKRRLTRDESTGDAAQNVDSLDGAPHDSPQDSAMAHVQAVDAPSAAAAAAAAAPPRAALDAAQLVQMALTLSEGRRRHASTGLAVPAMSADSRRVRSAGAAPPAVDVSPGSRLANDVLRPVSANTRNSRNSRNSHNSHSTATAPSHSSSFPSPSPSPSPSRPPSHRPADVLLPPHAHDEQRLGLNLRPSHYLDECSVDFHFSAATLNRAERATKFFELAHQYRRLLDHLPPLRPDSGAPGNYSFHTKSAPANEQPHITRTRSSTLSKHDLGRQYNPLQLLRNRRVRHREQRPLDPSPEAFDDVSRVEAYIDQVVDGSHDHTYRKGVDVVALPPFPATTNHHVTIAAQPTRAHKRTDTAVSRISRTVVDWSFNPSELLADAIWLEQSNNKALVENRHGNKIFPHLDNRSYESVVSGRWSKEFAARPSLDKTATSESLVDVIDEPSDKRGRKKRKLLSLRNVDNAARKHILRQRDRSTSSSDGSSHDTRKNPYRPPGTMNDDNIAPLERHLRTLIEKDNLKAGENSPERLSIDKWDREPDNHKQSANGAAAAAAAAATVAADDDDGHLSRFKYKQNAHGWSKTDDHTSADDKSRLSFDDSTAPNSPNVPNFVPSFGMSLSPPASRNSSPQRKSGVFGRFKSESKELNNIRETDFAFNHSTQSIGRTVAADESDAPRSSLDSLRPSLLKRNKTTNTFALTKSDRQNSKDSSVSRFFKGGRIGDLVRSETAGFGEVIWKKRVPAKDSHTVSDVSDDESLTADDDDDDDPPLKRRPNHPSRTSTASGSKQKFHTPGLPTFRSQNSSEKDGDATASKPRPVHRDQSSAAITQNSTSPDKHPDRDWTAAAPKSHDDRRRSSGFLSPLKRASTNASYQTSTHDLGLPGSIQHGEDKNFMTALANNAATRRASSQDKRHWSISDSRKALEQHTQMVSPRDIARIRALFLSSGVKAYELHNRAQVIVNPSSSFLLAAARLAGEDVNPVSAREEYILAAKLFSKQIQAHSDGLATDIDRFRSDQVSKFRSRLSGLKQEVEKLTPQIHSTTDDAEAFAVELTTHQTLAIKQVNDAIDNISRQRRRNLRMLTKVGFAMLEWLLLGSMWGVWFVVVIIRLVKGILGGFVKSVRWLLWL